MGGADAESVRLPQSELDAGEESTLVPSGRHNLGVSPMASGDAPARVQEDAIGGRECAPRGDRLARRRYGSAESHPLDPFDRIGCVLGRLLGRRLYPTLLFIRMHERNLQCIDEANELC